MLGHDFVLPESDYLTAVPKKLLGSPRMLIVSFERVYPAHVAPIFLVSRHRIGVVPKLVGVCSIMFRKAVYINLPTFRIHGIVAAHEVRNLTHRHWAISS